MPERKPDGGETVLNAGLGTSRTTMRQIQADFEHMEPVSKQSPQRTENSDRTNQQVDDQSSS